MTETTLIALALVGSLVAPVPARADVNVGVNVARPPALVVASPPRLVAVPGSSVFYSPTANDTLFAYGGGYYTVHGSTWFFAASLGSAWNIIATDRVPRSVLAVPATYYRISPSRAHKMGAPPFVLAAQVKGPKAQTNH